MSELAMLLNRQVPDFSFSIIAKREYESGKPKKPEVIIVPKEKTNDQRKHELLKREILKRLATGDVYSIPLLQNELVSEKIFTSISDSAIRKHLKRFVEAGIVKMEIGDDRYKTGSYWIE